MPRELKPCGTLAAYRRHLHVDEEPCQACQNAMQEYYRAWSLKRYGVRERPKAKHGTPSGYTKHIRAKEVPCAECRAARAAYEREARVVRAARKAARS